LRTLHEIGPELKRAISGDLETDFVGELEEPQHRVSLVLSLTRRPNSIEMTEFSLCFVSSI
jgi:hypothetical protein